MMDLEPRARLVTAWRCQRLRSYGTHFKLEVRGVALRYADADKMESVHEPEKTRGHSPRLWPEIPYARNGAIRPAKGFSIGVL